MVLRGIYNNFSGCFVSTHLLTTMCKGNSSILIILGVDPEPVNLESRNGITPVILFCKVSGHLK
jgi:hypothetical protein